VLDGNSLRAEAAALGALPGLRSLAVRSNGVDDKGARAIAKLGTLARLDLSGNRTRQLVGCVAHLEGLSALGLDACDLSGKDLSPLRKLVRLREIDVRLNERFWDAGAQTLSVLTELLAFNARPR